LVLRGYLYGTVSPSARTSIRRGLVGAGFGWSIDGTLHWRTIREEDWATAWKEHYHVEHAGNVAIRPAWREYTPKRGELVVTLDPGMAFGTGQHPTTRMALVALQELIQPDAYVLDLGAGSGVLAIAAIGLGARYAIAVDTEVQAYEACISNAALNGMEAKIRSVHGSLDEVSADGPYDLILANINAATVTRLAQGMHDVLKPGCYMVGGGIIEERLPGVEEALRAAGFTIERMLQEGDWRCLVCKRG
jgi:ribosomal protein L11 methyltransferase